MTLPWRAFEAGNCGQWQQHNVLTTIQSRLQMLQFRSSCFIMNAFLPQLVFAGNGKTIHRTVDVIITCEVFHLILIPLCSFSLAMNS